jgi:hypothetical protein
MMIFLDHMKLVGRQPREIKRLRKLLLEQQAGEVRGFTVEHEVDDSCCKKEPWPVTMLTLAGRADSEWLTAPQGSPAYTE